MHNQTLNEVFFVRHNGTTIHSNCDYLDTVRQIQLIYRYVSFEWES